MTLGELVMLLLLLEKNSNPAPKEVRALLCILGKKNSYLSLEELGKSTLIQDRELRRVMQTLAQKQLVQKEGCLYRKPESEKIARIIECR